MAEVAQLSYAVACHLRRVAWQEAKATAAAEVAAGEAYAVHRDGETYRLQAGQDLPYDEADARPYEEVVKDAASSSARTGQRASSAADSTWVWMAAELGLFWHHLVRGGGDAAWCHLSCALQQFHKCHWQHSWRGANLGGWFLLEPGPASPFFEKCHARIEEIRSGDAQQDSAGHRENPPGLHDEHSLCEALQLAGGEELRRSMFQEHRSSHYSAETLSRIKTCGLNAVRLPIGHWVVQESGEGEAFEGPCLDALDAAVDLIQASGLQVLLDLHGNPGGENGERPCGRSDQTWNWEKWRTEEALSILGRLAAHYCEKSCINGLQVCNEPAESIPAKRLCDFYEQAIEVIRANGMGADKVAVVLPIFTHWRLPEILQMWRDRGNFLKYDNVAFDLHYYHDFSSIWNLLSHQQHTDVVSHHALEVKSLPGAVVGEWSLSRPGQFSHEDQADFALKQVLAYNHASHGWFFWNWHDHDAYDDWDLERGVFGKGRLPNPLGPSELQGFLHPEWEDPTGPGLPLKVTGMWPRMMGWVSAGKEVLHQIWPWQ